LKISPISEAGISTSAEHFSTSTQLQARTLQLRTRQFKTCQTATCQIETRHQLQLIMHPMSADTSTSFLVTLGRMMRMMGMETLNLNRGRATPTSLNQPNLSWRPLTIGGLILLTGLQRYHHLQSRCHLYSYCHPQSCQAQSAPPGLGGAC
jgi:hypothetical protein